jgi:RNA-binding motif protein, X-linked 2
MREYILSQRAEEKSKRKSKKSRSKTKHKDETPEERRLRKEKKKEKKAGKVKAGKSEAMKGVEALLNSLGGRNKVPGNRSRSRSQDSGRIRHRKASLDRDRNTPQD